MQVRHDVARILTVLRAREILEAEGAYVAPTAAEHEEALANLAAEDAAVAEKAAARAAAAEAEEATGRRFDDDDTTMTTTSKRKRPDGRRDAGDDRSERAGGRGRSWRPARGSGANGRGTCGRRLPRPAAKAEPVPVKDGGTRPNRRKVREGVVVSDAMQSTVVVAVVERVRHPRYGKTVQRTKKLYVHDAEDTAKVGDRVRVTETRPLSKLKRWRLTEVVERAR